MPPGIADTPSPDAVLVAACAAARTALAAYNKIVEQDEPGAELGALFERERLAMECVAATRARTAGGIAEKALLLVECAETAETFGLALSLAPDAVALVRDMVGPALAQGRTEQPVPKRYRLRRSRARRTQPGRYQIRTDRNMLGYRASIGSFHRFRFGTSEISLVPLA